jgi:hypothetical protein
MRKRAGWRWTGQLVVVSLSCGLLICGCKALSDRLTRWKMLGNNAVEGPLEAVGGDGIVFSPRQDRAPEWGRSRLARASAQELVACYAPVFIQQRVSSRAQQYPYPPEYDHIGQARLRREGSEFKAFVAGQPRVYAIYEKRKIGNREHAQLTYTAWYPAHPRMKAFDVEEADIDSCVLRLTLDADNAPLFYETIAACGCFHKVFVQRWLEEQAKQTYGGPLSGKKYAVEQVAGKKSSIDWEVAGLVDEPRDRPRRPVVFIKAGDHKVIGMGTSARLRVPREAEVRPYELAEYAELYSLPVDGTDQKAPFFDLGKGGKVWGAERKKERFLMNFIGVDNAGHPRALNEIKMHFDQSTWGDPTIYDRYLRLPPGTL